MNPRTKAREQFKQYGSLATKLEMLLEELYETSIREQELRQQRLQKLLDFFEQHAPELRQLVARIATDKYAYNRETAAFTLYYLWTGWKIMPFEPAKRKAYYQKLKNYAAGLDWTAPILEKLLMDKRSGPVEMAVWSGSELEYASPEIIALYRRHLQRLCSHNSKDVRLEALRRLADLYPYAEAAETARHIVEPSALQRLLEASDDPEEEIRNWAYFELWHAVENVPATTERLFLRAVKREDPDSFAYQEAVTGLARFHNPLADAIIIDNLQNNEWMVHWFRPAEESHSAECLEALLAVHQLLLAQNEQSPRMDRLEEILESWND